MLLLLLLLLLTPTAWGQTPAPAEPPPDPTASADQSVIELVREQLSSHGRVAPPQALTDLGRRGALALLAVLWGAAPGGEGPPPPPLARTQRDRLLGWLAGFPRSDLAAVLGEIGLGEVPLDRKTRVVQVIRDIGRPDAFPLLARVARDVPGVYLRVPFFDGSWRGAVRAILERGGRSAWPQLEAAWPAIAEPLRAPTASAAASSGRPAAVRFLADRLGQHGPAFDEVALRELQKLWPLLPVSFDETVRRRVRGLLDATDAGVRGVAATTAGVIHDVAAADTLVERLDDPSRPVSRLALAALRRLAGNKGPADAGFWKRWLDDEREWAQWGWPDLRFAIVSGESASLLRALRQIHGHRFSRGVIVDVVAELLDHEGPAVRLAACDVLASLRSPYSIAALVRSLDDPDRGVGKAAWKALVDISGRKLPRDAASWRRAFPDA